MSDTFSCLSRGWAVLLAAGLEEAVALPGKRSRDEGRFWILVCPLQQCLSAPSKMQTQRRQGSDPTCSWESFLKQTQIMQRLISLMNPDQDKALPCSPEQWLCQGCPGGQCWFTCAQSQKQPHKL